VFFLQSIVQQWPKFLPRYDFIQLFERVTAFADGGVTVFHCKNAQLTHELPPVRVKYDFTGLEYKCGAVSSFFFLKASF